MPRGLLAPLPGETDEFYKLRIGETPKVYTADEAMSLLGIDLSSLGEDGGPVAEDWQDWLVTATPDRTKDAGLAFSLTTPEGYQLFDDDSILTPEGTRYTRDEWDALADEQPQFDLTDEEFMPLLDRVFAGTETPPGRQTGITYDQFGEPSPEMATFPGLDFSTMEPSEAIGALQQWLSQYPEEFVGAIAAKGHTEDTELLLRKIVPDISDDDLAAVFGEIGPSGLNFDITMDSGEVLPASIKPDKSVWITQADQVIQIGTWDDENDALIPTIPGKKDKRNFWQKLGGVWEAGVGQMVEEIWNATDWLNAKEGVNLTWLRGAEEFLVPESQLEHLRGAGA